MNFAPSKNAPTIFAKRRGNATGDSDARAERVARGQQIPNSG